MKPIAITVALLCCFVTPTRAQRGSDVDSLEYFSGKEDFEMASIYLDNLIKMNPTSAALRMRKAEYLVKMRQVEEAKKEFTKVIEIDPSIWQAYGQRGSIYLKSKQYDSAILDFTQIMGTSREVDSLTYSFRAYAYLESKNYKAASRDYDSIIRLRPKDPNLLNNRSYAREQLGDFKGALQDVNDAIDADKTYVRAYGTRALLYLRMGDRDEALASISVYLKAYPDDEMGNCLVGELLSYKKDYENAIPHLTVCVQKEARKDPYLLRAMAYYNTGQCSAAITDFLKILTFKLSAPEEAEALYHIGVCKNRQKPKSGCDFIRKAFQKGANDEKQKRVLLTECQ
ncbi:Tetratricopeptide repeat-containing protein [Chryseolinea serpens]|uniref:Tetratricopeptide repeat-containing protein n=1 Tax=Chryseolinea serpens TaxID=947013 RepID=A0A1M5XP54_9BACT|nr:tetratricopeptide repeat protein [Chryseolinea serpens]SHI01581.1 Tetratricopeptide repeat-containing protein [Chryseolinea serpens]